MSKSKFTSVINIKSSFNTVVNNIQYRQQLSIKALGDLMSYITLILNDYQTGNFTDIIKKYPTSLLHTIGLNLVKIKIDSTLLPQYAIAKQFSIICVQSLEQYINQYILLLETQYKLKNAEYYTDILFNTDKLKEYIDGLKKKMSLFPEVKQTLIVPAKILPQYEIYIERYGLPPSGIFDNEKLNNIIENLWL